MSADAVAGFWKKVDSDAGLQEKLYARGKMTLPELAAFAGEHGYAVTADELKSAADSISGELSEDELNAVVGGAMSTPMSSSLSMQSRITKLPDLGGAVAL